MSVLFAKDFMMYGDQSTSLKVKKLHEDAQLPTKAHDGDLGYDLFALEDVTLNPGVVTKVRTGIACNFPEGYGALIRDRSSVATKKEVFTVAGIIDNGYTGEIIVAFFNPGETETVTKSKFEWTSMTQSVTEVGLIQTGHERFQKGDKVAQMILIPVINFPVIETDDLATTTRAQSGFGSSGR